MKKLLHISANQFSPLDHDHHTKRIWLELAKGFDEYHILGRSKDNKFHRYQEGNLIMHLVPKLGNKARSFLMSSFYLFRLIPKYNITHLLAQSSILGGFTGVLASKLYKVPIMIEIHGDIYFKYFKKKSLSDRFWSYISKFALKKATKVRSLSSAMTVLLDNEGIVENVVEIPNRVDLELFKPPKTDYSLNNPIRIISVGRFVEQKGYDLAIKSILALSNTYDIELLLIGGGQKRKELEKIIGSSTNIQLIDWVDQKDLIKLLKKSDIYIQPSKPYYGEAMPRTLLEAMAMGLPIITTNIAAIPGILTDGKCARLIEPNSIAQLTSSITELIVNEKTRREFGLNAHMEAKLKYNWNLMFDKYRIVLTSMELEK